MSEEHRKIADFYDNIYYANARAAPPGKLNRHLQWLASKLSVQKEAKVLDIACGTGEWLYTLSQQGCVPHGIDISQKAVEICRQRMPQGDFHVGVAEQLPYADTTFDLVSCLGSLEHFVDQPGALAEMRRVATAQAEIVLLVPNAGFPPYRFGLYKGTHQTAARETVRALQEWEAMFHAAGLEVVDKWKDLHILNRSWIFRQPWHVVPLRLLQVVMLPVWPLAWQYQVYHLCHLKALDKHV